MSNVSKKIVYDIKPFKHISIGDPMYFEQIARGNDAKRYENLVCDIKTNSCKVGAVAISLIEEQCQNYNISTINVDIYLAKDNDQLKIYKDGYWFGDNTVSKEICLGCDTASYEIEVDGRYKKVHTGSDGYFGEVKKMKQYYGFIGRLSFDGDLFAFEEVEELMNYLFVFDK